MAWKKLKEIEPTNCEGQRVAVAGYRITESSTIRCCWVAAVAAVRSCCVVAGGSGRWGENLVRRKSGGAAVLFVWVMENENVGNRFCVLSLVQLALISHIRTQPYPAT